jgi:glyoxylase-like metal-dependent hydrolase (beta-lactamase superfamily II)
MPSRTSKSQVFRLGDFDCCIIYDGSRSIGSMTSSSARSFIFGDAPKAELDACLRHYGGLNSVTNIPFNYLMLKEGGHVMLLDVGCGDQAENKKHPDEPAGLLVENLSAAGLSVEDIDTVIVSHCHWDHFGGAVTDGVATFPNAEYVMSEKEAEHIRANVKGWALDYISILGDKLRLVSDASEVCVGITIRAAFGHTPGITVTEITSGNETLLYTSDLFLHKAHFEHPDWIPSFETDKVAAEMSRRRLIDDAYGRNMLLFVPHILSAFGRVERKRTSYKWVHARAQGIDLWSLDV